jgi:putative ATPase
VLPHVENATVTLLGATTENPSFEVNAALLSRSRVIRLEALEAEDLRRLVERALADPERGLGAQRVAVDPEAIDRLVALCGGDARIALNSLELAVQAAVGDPSGAVRVTVADIEGALQNPALLHDRAGDQHYWLISAFIKSVRGSDPDAAVYWLARMLEAGEDPLFVARRLVILAAEDIGLADPHALGVAVAAQQAAHFIGMPEGFLPLSEATLYLAAAPKSNSVLRAYVAAAADVAETLHQPVPLHLRNAVTGLGRAMGYGTGYRYAHDHEGGVVEQEHLPESLVGHRYYEPSDHGAERDIAERLDATRRHLSRRKAES